MFGIQHLPWFVLAGILLNLAPGPDSLLVPQFIVPDAPDKAVAFLLLGVIFNTTGTLWCHILALLTAFASERLRASARLGQWLQRAIGVMFVSFGVRLALAQRN
jgi:threonine/homoserine/homoserine lactone efflux protein